jgi:hypothetical protein
VANRVDTMNVFAVVAAVLLVAIGVAYGLTYEPAPVVGIVWRAGITPARRAALERRFLLVNPVPAAKQIKYDLLDPSRENLAALVNEADLADTESIDRREYALPIDFTYGTSWMWIAHRTPVLRIPGVVEGIVLMCVAVLAVRALHVVRRWRERDQCPSSR